MSLSRSKIQNTISTAIRCLILFIDFLIIDAHSLQAIDFLFFIYRLTKARINNRRNFMKLVKLLKPLVVSICKLIMALAEVFTMHINM